MLTSLGVQNLRSFKEFTSIELKPITVFIGKNSSGKSSFLRVLPLLSQSTQEATNGPILWYGRLVDFGDFKNAINNNSTEKEISFHFNLNLIEDHYPSRFHYFIPSRTRDSNQLDVGIKISVTNPTLKTITKSIEINIDDTYLKIDFNSQKKGNNILVWNDKFKLEKKISIINSDGEMLPKIMFFMSEQEDKTVRNYPFEVFAMRDEYFDGFSSTPLVSVRKKNRAFYDDLKTEATTALKKFFHDRTNSGKIKKILEEPLAKLSQIEITNSLIKVSTKQTTFLKNLQSGKNNHEEIKIIQVFSLINNFNSLSTYLNEQLKKSFSSVKYIGPSRAIAERFYRFQDLQVNTLDHTGSNFAMILNSLPSKQKSKFREWTKITLDFLQV